MPVLSVFREKIFCHAKYIANNRVLGINYNRNASNFYKLKAFILMLQFFPDFLHIQTAREYKFADEKQKDKKPVPCSLIQKHEQ